MSTPNWHTALVVPPYAEPVSLVETKLQRKIESAVTEDDLLLSGIIRAAIAYVETPGRRLITQTVSLVMDRFPCGRIIELPLWPVSYVSSITYIDTAGASQTFSSANYNTVASINQCRIQLIETASWPDTQNRIGAVTVQYVVGYCTPFTAALTDVVTCKGLSPVNGTRIRIFSTGTLPTGLSSLTDYYIVSASGSTCGFALTEGGAAVDVTNTGVVTDTHFLSQASHVGPIHAIRQAISMLVGHWWANREAVVVEQGFTSITVPLGVQSLLSTDHTPTF